MRVGNERIRHRRRARRRRRLLQAADPASKAVETPFTRLTGRSAADIVIAMEEFRTGKRPATVMDRIAKGFTDDEIKAIAAWYAAQKD